jgi:surfactin synthase thioesterase subunit
MIPSAFRWRERLPLTANSKIDVKTLTALAGQAALPAGPGDDAGPGYRAPVTATELRLTAAWATVLGIPPDQIGRHDNFFELGGTSLSAVKVAITLDRAVSLKDLTHHPVLADLAGLVDGRSERPSGLLQSLLEPDGGQNAALVCFPYAGGNAVNFQSMARALRGSGLAVYAAELPGHDLAAENEPFVPMAQVVEQACAEITRFRAPRVLLWGHSSGAAFAMATARKLGEAGVDVQRVFVAAQLPGEAADRRTSITDLTGRSDAEIAAELTSGAGDFRAELGQLDAPRAEQIGAAYRHDCVSAHRWIADALDRPPTMKLSAPVTVVVAADDPYTAGSRHRYREWRLLADQVDLHELADGGHYFLRTRPAQAAQAVLRANGWPASS